MTKYLLDSNILSEPTKPNPNKSLMTLLIKNQVVSSLAAVSYFEMLHGILVLSNGKYKNRLMAYLEEVVVPFYNFISFNFSAAKINAELTAKLESVGKRLPIIDSQIASIALANNLVLVTRNTKDFLPIQEYFPLVIENWFDM